MAPTLITHYEVYSAAADQTTLTTPSFTPANNEVIVVKLQTWDTANGMAAPTGGGQTYQAIKVVAPGGFNGWCALYTATISGSPVAMTISSAPATAVNTRHTMVVERWGNAQLAATPATNSTVNGSASAPSAVITTVGNNSALSWCSVDENSQDPATRAYLLSATEDGLYDGHVGTNSVHYNAYAVGASVGAAGSYTIGMSAPSNQIWVIAGVEIQAAASTTLPVPQWETQPGSRPRWLPKLRRGKRLDPVLPQANQGQAWPSVERQSGSRPKWLPKLRRGTRYDLPLPQANQGQAYPQWLDPPGVRPRWLPKLRRGKQYEPPWPQGQQGVSHPQWISQAGSHPRWLPKLRRSKQFEPQWPQGQQGQNFPTWLTQPGSHPRWLPKLRRSKQFEPSWPAVIVPAPVAPNLIGRRSIFRPVRRGRFVEIVPTLLVPPQPLPVLVTRRAKVGPHSRPHFFHPPWAQGPQLYWAPTVIESRRSVTSRPVRRGHRFDPFWPQGRILSRDLIITFGKLRPKWQIGQLQFSGWMIGTVGPKWEVGNLEVTSISASSLEYVRVGPISAQVNGVAINPTADTVQMAFIASTAAPTVGDWKAASWNNVGNGQYQIQCLVGSGGAVQLTTGYWYVWVQITDNPEIVVRSVDILQVTV